MNTERIDLLCDGLVRSLGEQHSDFERGVSEATGGRDLFEVVAENLGVPLVDEVGKIPGGIKLRRELADFPTRDVAAVVFHPPLNLFAVVRKDGCYASMRYVDIMIGGWRELLELRKEDNDGKGQEAGSEAGVQRSVSGARPWPLRLLWPQRRAT